MQLARQLRRSGEHATALCPWDFAENVANWMQAFSNGASDRWAYRLRRRLLTLQALPTEAVVAEIKRELQRAEEETRRELDPDGVAKAFHVYQDSGRFAEHGEAFKQFLTLVQSASFLVRGRDL